MLAIHILLAVSSIILSLVMFAAVKWAARQKILINLSAIATCGTVASGTLLLFNGASLLRVCAGGLIVIACNSTAIVYVLRQRKQELEQI